jgi:Protein of unknown function (DUF3761)
MIRVLSSRSLLLVTAIALAPFALQAQGTTCKDGTTSAAAGKGACSGHGGVDKKAAKAAKSDAKVASKVAKADTKAAKAETKPAVKAEKSADKATNKAMKAETKQAAKSANATATAPRTTASNTDPTDATAKCKDGTYSHAKTHRGACSRHGGVAEWLKT